MRSGDAIRDAQATTVYRYACVRYPTRLRPGRTTPVLVTLSVRELDPVANVAHASQAGIVLKSAPVVDVELVLPGCTVYPAGKRPLDPTADVSHVRFDVVANATGTVVGARVCLTQDGRSVAELPLEIVSHRAWPGLFASAATTLFTLAVFVLKFFGVDLKANGVLTRTEEVFGAVAVLGLPAWVGLFGAAGVIAAVAWWLRPRPDAFFQLVPVSAAEDARARIGLAYLAVRAGDVVRAEELLRLLTADYPDYAPGWFLLGDWRYDRGDRRESLEAFRRGLRLGGSAPPVVYAKAAAAAATARDFALALAWVTDGLEPDAEDRDLRAVMLYNRGCYLSQLDQPDEAEAALAAAVANGFTDPRRYQTDRDLDPLRARPRFRELLTELSLAS